MGSLSTAPIGRAEFSTSAEMSFTSLSDPALIRYTTDSVYQSLVENLDSESYFVENVSAVYISQEYIEELAYNSQANIFFGYTLSEINSQFVGERYIFTLGNNNQTIVQPFVLLEDNTYSQIIQNIAVGTGVILICVTVSVVSAGLGAPAVSMIFAASATKAVAFGTSGFIIGGLSAGIIKGIETKNFDETLNAALLHGSEGFKWGAIVGSITGGVEAGMALKGATLNGLTMNEAATIQRQSKYPLDIIKQFKSMDEYQVYKNAGLKVKMVDGQTSLVRDIDLNHISELGEERVTNLLRMQKGYAPIDPVSGKPFQLHHVAQNSKGTLAILTEAEHQGNSAILNIFGKESEIARNSFAKIRKSYWQSFARTMQ